MNEQYRGYIQEALKLTAAVSTGIYLGGRYAGRTASKAQRQMQPANLPGVEQIPRDWVGKVQETLFIVAVLALLATVAWMYFDYTGESDD